MNYYDLFNNINPEGDYLIRFDVGQYFGGKPASKYAVVKGADLKNLYNTFLGRGIAIRPPDDTYGNVFMSVPVSDVNDLSRAVYNARIRWVNQREEPMPDLQRVELGPVNLDSLRATAQSQFNVTGRQPDFTQGTQTAQQTQPPRRFDYSLQISNVDRSIPRTGLGTPPYVSPTPTQPYTGVVPLESVLGAGTPSGLPGFVDPLEHAWRRRVMPTISAAPGAADEDQKKEPVVKTVPYAFSVKSPDGKTGWTVEMNTDQETLNNLFGKYPELKRGEVDIDKFLEISDTVGSRNITAYKDQPSVEDGRRTESTLGRILGKAGELFRSVPPGRQEFDQLTGYNAFGEVTPAVSGGGGRVPFGEAARAVLQGFTSGLGINNVPTLGKVGDIGGRMPLDTSTGYGGEALPSYKGWQKAPQVGGQMTGGQMIGGARGGGAVTGSNYPKDVGDVGLDTVRRQGGVPSGRSVRTFYVYDPDNGVEYPVTMEIDNDLVAEYPQLASGRMHKDDFISLAEKLGIDTSTITQTYQSRDEERQGGPVAREGEHRIPRQPTLQESTASQSSTVPTVQEATSRQQVQVTGSQQVPNLTRAPGSESVQQQPATQPGSSTEQPVQKEKKVVQGSDIATDMVKTREELYSAIEDLRKKINDGVKKSPAFGNVVGAIGQTLGSFLSGVQGYESFGRMFEAASQLAGIPYTQELQQFQRDIENKVRMINMLQDKLNTESRIYELQNRLELERQRIANDAKQVGIYESQVQQAANFHKAQLTLEQKKMVVDTAIKLTALQQSMQRMLMTPQGYAQVRILPEHIASSVARRAHQILNERNPALVGKVGQDKILKIYHRLVVGKLPSSSLGKVGEMFDLNSELNLTPQEMAAVVDAITEATVSTVGMNLQQPYFGQAYYGSPYSDENNPFPLE